MAHFFRLMLAAFVAVFSLAVHAAIPPLPQFYGNWGWGDDNVYGSSAGDVCAAMLPALVRQYPAPSTAHRVVLESVPTPGQSGICRGYAMHPDGNERTLAGGLVNIGSGTSCPANSTLNGAVCVCTSPMVEDPTHTSCVSPPDPCQSLAGQGAGDWVRDKGANAAGTGPVSRSWSVCDAYSSSGGGKCVVTVANATCDEVGFGSDAAVGQGFYRCTGKGVYTGTSAIAGKCDASSSGKGTGDTPADPSPATPPVPGSDPPKAPTPKPADGLPAPAPCGAGQAPGTVNGSTACYPTGSDVPKAGGKDSSTNNADGSKETKHEETTCNAGGSKCSTDTTVCKTPASGGAASCTTANSTDTAQGTCQKSPGNSVCAGGGNGAPGSSFGGNCKSGFKAVGEDPVLNAMAQEQYTRNCQVFATDAPESVVVANASDASGLQKATTPGDSTVSIGSGNFDTSDSLGGASCSLNKTITVAHMTATLPFNVICDPLAYLGQVLVAVSLLLAARIVARG